MAILGEKEATENSVSVRRRLIGDQGTKKSNQLLESLISEIKQRSQPHLES